MSTSSTRRGFLATLLAAPAALFALSRVTKGAPATLVPYREYTEEEIDALFPTVHRGPPPGELWFKRTDRLVEVMNHADSEGMILSGRVHTHPTLIRRLFRYDRIELTYPLPDALPAVVYVNPRRWPTEQPLATRQYIPVRDLALTFHVNAPIEISWWERVPNVTVHEVSLTLNGRAVRLA